MSKITLENYFDISKFLEDKKELDFKRYQENRVYDEDKQNELSQLINYYEFEGATKESSYLSHLKDIKKVFLVVAFLLGFAFTYIYFDKEINIKIYSLFSIALPSFYLLFLFFKVFMYKYPENEDNSLLNTFLTKYSNFKPKHNHILKTYSNLMFIEAGISYTLGVLISTVIIFWAYSITFYSESTYLQDSMESNKTEILKTTSEKQTKEIKSQQFYSMLITFFIFMVIVLKILLRISAKKALDKTIKNTLLKDAELFFDVMQTTVGIDENKIEYNSNAKTKDKSVVKYQETDDSYDDMYILYYQLKDEVLDKVDFDFSKDEELRDKSSQSYTFALFKQLKKDRETISKLGNLVMIFTSPQSSADETFKQDIKDILKRDSVHQIWVVPLIEKNSRFVASKKGDEKYDEYRKQINKNINDTRVRLYNEK